MRERYQDKCTTLLVAETRVGEEIQGKGDQWRLQKVHACLHYCSAVWCISNDVDPHAAVGKRTAVNISNGRALTDLV